MVVPVLAAWERDSSKAAKSRANIRDAAFLCPEAGRMFLGRFKRFDLVSVLGLDLRCCGAGLARGFTVALFG
ncbi:MAG TPA: hypothetical protein VG734_04240 [Lacunisphaera sp.]|nr:hypothetical protein [Lacunisphaera sp.]